MKNKCFFCAVILLTCIYELSFSQTDSSLLQYFPLQKGNLWQYRYRTNFGGSGYLVNMVSYGDTMMPNGLIYIKAFTAPYEPSGLKYYRIDSSYRIQEYSSWLGDTCGGLYNEFNFFRLNESDSAFWTICYNVGGDLFPQPYKLRYLGEKQMFAFGSPKDIMLYKRYAKVRVFNDTMEFYGKTFLLMKDIGIYYTEWGEEGSSTLEGAIINGVKYGNVVGVFNEREKKPQNFILNQNYPNPFNSETVISFVIGTTQNIKLEVYNTLGQLITILENNVLNSGIHARVFYSGNISSGIYYVRLQTNNQTAIKKMMHIK